MVVRRKNKSATTEIAAERDEIEKNCVEQQESEVGSDTTVTTTESDAEEKELRRDQTLSSSPFRYRACASLLLFATSTFFFTAYDNILIGVLLSFCGTLACHGFGAVFYPDYDWYMPFCGNVEFILLQAQGYTVALIANLLAITVYLASDESPSLVFRFALAGSQISAMWATLQALFCYRHTRGRRSTAVNKPGVKLDWWMLVSIITSSIIFLYPVERGTSYFIPATVFCSLSAIFYHLDRNIFLTVRSSSFFRPTAGWNLIGGREYTVLQAQGWFFLGCLINVVLTIEYLELTQVRGTGFLCASLQTASIFCLSQSINQYQDSASIPAQPISLKTYLITLAKLAMLLAFMCLVPYFCSPWLYVCSSKQFMVILVAAPLAHVSGWLRIPTYRGFRLSGGVRSMILQSNGWLVYLIALVCSQAPSRFFVPVMGPAGIIATICIGLSVHFHEDVAMETTEKKQGKPVAWYLCSLALFMLYISYLGLNSYQLASLALFLHSLAVPVGLHMMWTHWGLVGSILAYFTGNAFWLSVFCVLACGVTIPWYAMAILNSDTFIGFRALSGWSLFLGEQYQRSVDIFVGDYVPALKKKDFRGPFHHASGRFDKFILYGSYFFLDISFHFLPSLLMLQYIEHVSPLSVLVAFLISQAWRRLVSFHHISPDWDHLWDTARVKWNRRKHSEGYKVGRVDVDAFSAIYGFVNSDFPEFPQSGQNFLENMENGTFLVLTLVTGFSSPSSTLQAVARLSGLASQTFIILCITFTGIGGIGIASWALKSFLSVPTTTNQRGKEIEASSIRENKKRTSNASSSSDKPIEARGVMTQEEED